MSDRTIASPRQRWARPGGTHDLFVRGLRIALPVAVAVLLVVMGMAPFAKRGEISFVLDKNTVAMARERMRVTAAVYRGEDGKGQPFTIRAGSAVQVSSRDPVVQLNDLSARIELGDGPAMLTATRGKYDMDREIISVTGPLSFTAADGYALKTRDVAIGLKTRKLASGGAVNGSMPLGTFSANQLRADLNGRTVTLEGRARLHIVQGRAR